MRIRFYLASCLFLAASTAYAQQAPSYRGTWMGTATTGSGGQVQVKLHIGKKAGMLRLSQVLSNTYRDQCLERDLPVALNTQTETELNITIEGEMVLRGCIDETATLKFVDGKTLQGKLQDGRVVQLTRSK